MTLEPAIDMLDVAVHLVRSRRSNQTAPRGILLSHRDATQDNRIERFVWLNDPTPTHLRVLNVSCGVFAEDTTETDVVERAFRRLPRVSAAPTTVPSEDAVHG